MSNAKGQLTIRDAKVIAASKNFHMPVVYEEAVRSLKSCRQLDEAEAFINAAEALAVWAKIYRQDEAGRQAKQLKLHAHRRMGQLARELAPGRSKPGGGRYPGPVAKLQEYGLSRHQANAAHHMAKLPKKDFETLVNQDMPPAPTSAARRFRRAGSTTQWDLLRTNQRNPFACQTFIASTDAATVARSLNAGEVPVARKMAIDLMEWLDAFEQALPKKEK